MNLFVQVDTGRLRYQPGGRGLWRADRLPATARVLDYLGAAGDFGALAARTLVADAATRIAASTEHFDHQDRSPEPGLDARQALMHMRDVLDELQAPVPVPPE